METGKGSSLELVVIFSWERQTQGNFLCAVFLLFSFPLNDQHLLADY